MTDLTNRYAWEANSEGVDLLDCLPKLEQQSYGGDHALAENTVGESNSLLWYGGGEFNSKKAAWPMRHDLKLSPFMSGGEVWGNSIRGLFLSNPGVSLKVNQNQGVDFSFGDSDSGKGLCLRAKRYRPRFKPFSIKISKVKLGLGSSENYTPLWYEKF